MKPASTQFSKPHPPVYQTVVHKPGPLPKVALTNPKSEKRENIFSQARDTREERSARPMKNMYNPQTFSHGH